MTIKIQKLPESPEQFTTVINHLQIINAQQSLQIQEYKRKHKESSLQKERAALLCKIQKRDEQIKERDDKIKACNLENDILRELLRLARMARFASHSEKLPSTQYEIFNEVEALSLAPESESSSEADSITVPEHKRNRGKRKPLPDHLPREEVIIDLPENEKICDKDGTALQETGRDISEKLDVVPAQFKVIRTIRIKYGCPCCDQEGETNIKIAPLPESILPKSNATPGLLAFILTNKYIDALPLYRLEKIFERNSLELPRNTMARWIIGLKDQLLQIYKLMETDLLASTYICCDETVTQVLKENEKTPQSKSYMWVRTRHGPGVSPIVLFDYDPSRSGTVPNLLLAGFLGYLQVDGYAGYNEVCLVEGVTRVGCMAHVRRKFVEVYKTSKNKSKPAFHVLQFIKGLYKIEAEIKDKSVEDRFKIRQEQAKPILEKIKAWLDANQNSYPSGLMGKAITYATNQWEFVTNYLLDGRLDIDNNFTENRIRPFAIGRKNWLFSDSVEGAKASAMIYSILQTARANGLEPYAYMRYLLTELPKCKTAEQLALLPPHKIDPKLLH